MGSWTHVAGIIRIDGFGHTLVRGPKESKEKVMLAAIEKAMGKPWDFDDGPPERNEAQAGNKGNLLYEDKKEVIVPSGSEGSIMYKVFPNRPEDRDNHSLSWGYISLWGDLRDVISGDSIKKWFKESLLRLQKPEGFGDPESMNMVTKMNYMLSVFGIREALLVIQIEYGVDEVILWDNETKDIIVLPVPDKKPEGP